MLGRVGDLLEDGVAHRRVAGDDGDSEDRALVQILRADLGDRDVEASADAIPEACSTTRRLSLSERACGM